jgi:2-succinyl-5-enolpyruvyl-6-hydroxy-3-cyclohexene-1-carboxylate synthase
MRNKQRESLLCCVTAPHVIKALPIAFPGMGRTNRNTALASAFVEELARSGVREAVIAPGSRSTPLALALWRQEGIEARVIVDERSAGFFALGAALAGGRPVAVLCTSGTAAANLHPAVCEADESNVPLIVLTADRPPELRGIGAGQTIDQLKLYGSAVRWFCEVGTHEADDEGLLHLRSVACRAHAAAAGDARPGPVHLNLPWRDPLGPEPHPEDVTASSALALEGRPGGRPLTQVPRGGGPAPSPTMVDAMAGHVREDARGLIVCGRQPDPALAEPVAALARATGYPILAEPTSQLRLGPHDRDLVISAYDAIARVGGEALEPELIIRFGDLPTSKALRAWLAGLGEVHQVVFDPSFGWNQPTRAAVVIVRTDPIALANDLAGAVDEGERGDWAERWRAADRAAADAIASELEAASELSEPAVHAGLGELYADGDLVYTASSMPIRDQEAFLRPGSAAVRFLANRGANGIDGLISSGIGAAAATGSPTWIVTGDLGVFHDSNGLAALRDASAPVRIVVLDNGGGGIFELLPQAEQLDRDDFEALFATPVDIDAGGLAALHGLAHARVESLSELADAARSDTALIEIRTERRANAELHRRLAESAVTAVERSLG